MKKLLAFTSFVTVMVLFFPACAFKYDYGNVIAELTFSGTSTIGVATHDQRAGVVAGKRRPNYVGVVRGGGGNPFTATTESRRPLSDEMSQAIAGSLSKMSFKTITAVTLPNDSEAIVLDKLKATKGEKLLLLTLYEWRSDSLMMTRLFYKAKLRVFDPNGQILAESAIHGDDALSGALVLGTGHNDVSAAFKKKIEELLGSQNVVKALIQ